MGNVSMEAYQVHYRGDESVSDHLRKIDLDVEKAAALPDLPTAEGKKVLTAITDDQGDTALSYAAPDVEQTDIAPVFSDLTNYNAGDLVYYEGELWRFTVDHVAGAWDAGDAGRVSVSDCISDLKNTLIDYVKIVSSDHSVTFLHEDYTNLVSYKPTDNNYNWYLIGVLPSSAGIQIIGMQPSASRCLSTTSTGQSSVQVARLNWLGIKK